MSIAQEVIDELTRQPNQTIIEVSRKLKRPSSSVSSIVCRMIKRGKLLRLNGQGKRGGYIYWVPNDNPPAPSA